MKNAKLLLLALAVTTLPACGGGAAPGQPGPTPPGQEQPAPTPSPAPAPGAYTVTGRILTEGGEPLAGVEVTATHTVSYTYGTAKTDAQGRYRIALPQTLGSWDVAASMTLTFGGQDFDLRLAPEIDTPFAGAQGAVRDFVYRAEDAPRGKVFDYISNSDVEIDYGTLEVTFTPDGPNAAKSTETVTIKYPYGYGLPDLPLGQYYVTASQMRGGVKEQLLIATRDNPNFTPRALARFLPDSHYGPTLELFWKNP
ncbi:carboxypeptidase regulatory-like domain-containing protein [Deinococcus sp. SDU3-2]|uniref:Carboxypeptidase regulatory-like domain-containing protein n=1 Tax=Deinococcus terrestris TaxID=2651870 RepID=A0A7X1NVT3_9DEIO|nr:carboxypeptidase-like regulatory domain-containing protein [Deinococcus terrestris]MPY66409.1 carboxypeptidase regulatory-like domain-containing protein [Deinococcus terrestris]